MEEFTRLLAYSYSEQHLILDARTSGHSCRFAVDAGALDDHLSKFQLQAVCQMHDIFYKASELLDRNDTSSLVDTSRRFGSAIQKEIKSLRKTVPIFREVVMQYMAHRLRAKVQFA
jgi:hypothetical protein